MANYPQVRLVFKDFPLEQHPWARSAAIAGRCAYNQDPKAFWKLYDLIYDNQDIISPENSYAKLTDYASQIGLNPDTFKTCMASPEAAAAVDASRANGVALASLQHAHDLHQRPPHRRRRPAPRRAKHQV